MTLNVLNGALNAVIFSGDGKTLALAGHDSRVILLDTTTGKQKSVLNITSVNQGNIDWAQVHGIAFSTDGRCLATASDDGFNKGSAPVQLWEISSGMERAKLDGPKGTVFSLAFNPNANLLAMGGRMVSLWDYAKDKQEVNLNDQKLVHCVTFSSDYKFLASAGSRTIMLWKMPAINKAAK